MIYCPKCGTANRDESRFCNECGEELAIQTQIECPRCGTLNPFQNVLCTECNARLPTFAPTPPDAGATPIIKGLSLPTKNPASEQNEEADAAATPEAEQDDEAPAWLRELGASLSAEGEADDSEASEDTEVPDWLRDLRASLPEEPEDEVEPEEEEETLPDWLAAPDPGASEEEDETASRWIEPEPELEPQPTGPEELAAEIESEDEPLATEPQEDEIPGWLSRLVPSAAVPGHETEPPPSAEEKTPGWLSKLVPGEAEAEPEAAPAAPQEEVEIPAWLTDVQAEDEEAKAIVEAEPTDLEIEAGEIPDWVAELRPGDEEAEGDVEPPDLRIEAGEIPDWMAELGPAGEEAEGEAEPTDLEIEAGEIPDWMTELRPEGEEAEGEAEPADLEIEKGEVPDWLAALRPAAEEEEPEPSGFEIEEEEPLDRVTELEPPSEELPLAEALVSPDEAEAEPPAKKPAFKLPDEVEAALGPAVPAWLAELQIEAPEAAAAIIEEAAIDGELPEWLVRSEIEPDGSLAPAEIPGWLLALKPPELREEGAGPPSAAVKEWIPETGLLAGIAGTLPVEMLIAQPRAVAVAGSVDLTIEDSPAAQLFSEIVGRSPDAAPKEIPSPRADVLPGVARGIIYAILFIVVALPIILGRPLLPRTIEPTAATVDMHRAIESLNNQAPVLVAFDYDPSSSGEMDVVARALIGHLMDREANLVIVSLLPAGPATAQSLLDELAADRPGYAGKYGERYVNLGYLPGQAAAVRLLGLSVETALPRDYYGTPVSDIPAMQGLDSAQAFSLIVELAATQDTLRWWIEQAGTPYAIPLGTGASASVIPFARPYYETESRQLVGLVGGVPDTATYEALASGQNSPTSGTAARLDSQLAGQLLFVLVILAGNVVYFSRRGTRRER